jgi:hypothetical protein
MYHSVHLAEADLQSTVDTERLDFSSVTEQQNLGIVGQTPEFVPEGIKMLLLRSMAPGIIEECQFLLDRLNEIYDHVTMDVCIAYTPCGTPYSPQTKFEAGARMIIDAILLSVAKISAKRQAGHAVAILPGMRLGASDGIRVVDPISTSEIWLNGSLDYGVVQYHADLYQMLGLDDSRKDIFRVAAGQLFVVLVKGLMDTGTNLFEHMPEAVSQTMAVSDLQISGYEAYFIRSHCILHSTIQAINCTVLLVQWAPLDCCCSQDRI